MTETKQTFREYLTRQGLKSTRQRDVILDEFLRSGSHLSTEELYLRLRKSTPASAMPRSIAPSSSSPDAASPRSGISAMDRPL
jgi:hypothetical protein